MRVRVVHVNNEFIDICEFGAFYCASVYCSIERMSHFVMCAEYKIRRITPKNVIIIYQICSNCVQNKSYKIVQLNNRNKIELMAVPPAWVNGSEHLFLPKTNIRQLLNDINSEPDSKWKHHQCVVKRFEHMPSYEKAMEKVAEMEELSDTGEEFASVSKKKPIARSVKGTAVIKNPDLRRNDFNDAVSTVLRVIMLKWIYISFNCDVYLFFDLQLHSLKHQGAPLSAATTPQFVVVANKPPEQHHLPSLPQHQFISTPAMQHPNNLQSNNMPLRVVYQHRQNQYQQQQSMNASYGTAPQQQHHDETVAAFHRSINTQTTADQYYVYTDEFGKQQLLKVPPNTAMTAAEENNVGATTIGDVDFTDENLEEQNTSKIDLLYAMILKMNLSISNLHSKMDLLLSQKSGKIATDCNVENAIVRNQFEPLKTLEELNELNEKIKAKPSIIDDELVCLFDEMRRRIHHIKSYSFTHLLLYSCHSSRAFAIHSNTRSCQMVLRRP